MRYRFCTQALHCLRPFGMSPIIHCTLLHASAPLSSPSWHVTHHPLHALRSNPDPLPPPFARQVIYAGVVVTANVKLCLMTLTFNWINSLFLVLHLVGWYGFALVYHNVEAFGTVFAIGEQFASPSFWLVHVVTVTICHVPGILFFVIRENYFPTLKVCACQLPRAKKMRVAVGGVAVDGEYAFFGRSGGQRQCQN